MSTSVGQISLDMVLNGTNFRKQLSNVQNQANSASQKMAASFKKIGAAVAAAFSVAMVKRFGEECINLANIQTEAETKLTTIMKQRMQATDKSIQKIKDYASAQQQLGVVGDEVQLAGAQQLATFLKTDEALKELIPAMNNLAVQQNGVNVSSGSMVNIGNLMGKVMQGQTSALTRVGITFDEAQEKVLKYGNEQERAAMLAQVITDNVGEMNKAIASTPAGKLQQIKNNFGDIKETLGRALNNIFVPLLTYIDKAVQKLAVLAKKFEEFTISIFGESNSAVTSGISTVADDAEKASEEIQSVEDSSEKAKGSLAGFDKLNVLSNSNSSNSDSNTTGSSISSGIGQGASSSSTQNAGKGLINSLENAFNKMYEKSGFKDFIEKVQKGINSVDWSSISENCKKIFEKAVPIVKTYVQGVAKAGKSALGAVGSYVGGVVKVAGKSFQTLTGGISKWLEKDGNRINKFIENYYNSISKGFDNLSTFFDGWFDIIGNSVDRMRPTMETAISNLLSGFSDFGIGVGTVISDGFEIATQSLTDWVENSSAEIGLFYDNIQLQFADVMNLIGDIFSDIGTTISNWWNGDGAGIFQNICDMFTNIGTTFMNVYNEWIKPAWDFIVSIVQSAWNNWLSPVFDGIVNFFGKWCDCISTVWNNFLSPLVNYIVDFWSPIITNIFNAVKGVFDTVFTTIGGFVSGLLEALGGLLDFVTGVFSGNWEKAWNGIKDFFKGIWEGIWSILKGIINLIIDALNCIWTGVYNVVSGIVNGIGGIAGALGDIFGQDWHFSMPAEPTLIPKFAKGAIVKAPTLAVVGDNAGANTGDPEVISPLSKLQSMIKTSSGEDVVILKQMLDYLKRIYEMFVIFRNNGGNHYEFVAKINGSEIFDEIVKQNELYKKRHNGKSAFA
ncbi:hypothetical protein [uncultured Ruminococcus sp.]|uniref:phage tail protein n=1 Tax=uncultured Ruminococcus sp. TaxID=165186 RepID=UPI0025F6AEFC|nr:hypothetical protein [uncultured Ruminococcus sp.]